MKKFKKKRPYYYIDKEEYNTWLKNGAKCQPSKPLTNKLLDEALEKLRKKENE